MTHLPTIARRLRHGFVALAAALLAGEASPVAAPVRSASVVSIVSASAADLVVLDHGFDAGLRQGMVCRVTRGEASIAEVQLVTLRPTCSAALILDLAPAQTIRAGDVVTVNLLKT